MRIRRCFNAFVLVTALAVGTARADVAVSGLFSDHMVLQRELPVSLWGTAQAGEKIKIHIADHSASAEADVRGHWEARLEPLAAGGPYELSIAGNNTITIHDVLVGEVWLCSGQSNMAFGVKSVINADREIATAKFPKIRLLTVARTPAQEPGPFSGKAWEVCSPETIEAFSAVGFFFGRDLQKELDVPIGLINSSVGGTPAEAWTPRAALESDPDLRAILKRAERQASVPKADSTGTPAARPAGKRNARTGQEKPGTRAAETPAGQAQARAAAIAEARGKMRAPTVLYNGMIHPLVPYTIRGVIWYQGEGNNKLAYQYRKLFPTMIRSWRQTWGQGDFPFLFVQLANWKAGQKEPYQSAWAELREAQLMTLLLPATAMVVTTDVSEPDDIHPKNKQDVGKRLALAARALAYGEKIVYSGPLYDSMSVDGERIRLKFKHVGGGLEARGGGALKSFAIAGADKQWVEATAAIDGDTVVVHSEKVAHPVAVRYAWGDVPDCNFFNKDGLPASPFRTDDWPGITVNAK